MQRWGPAPSRAVPRAQFGGASGAGGRFARRGRSLLIALDDSGIEVRRWTSDGYKMGRRAGELPDPDLFRLLDVTELPPVQP